MSGMTEQGGYGVKKNEDVPPSSLAVVTLTPEEDACEIHADHSPVGLLPVYHHIIPQSWCLAAHVPIDPEKIRLYATCHDNIHVAIDLLVTHEGDIPWDIRRHIGAAEMDLARYGYDRALQMDLKPKLTL